ncbi:hypothetical protein ELI_1386 [Eubacterium callanderi]|uniref:Uncharacterized protein n=1 Tax=Eubacterium callanderi TaxID=53442 RepID=E3GL81_9FIRM|nr:hypothetical protein ELI_1386 [Eubacterium callanderi]
MVYHSFVKIINHYKPSGLKSIPVSKNKNSQISKCRSGCFRLNLN